MKCAGPDGGPADVRDRRQAARFPSAGLACGMGCRNRPRVSLRRRVLGIRLSSPSCGAEVVLLCRVFLHLSCIYSSQKQEKDPPAPAPTHCFVLDRPLSRSPRLPPEPRAVSFSTHLLHGLCSLPDVVEKDPSVTSKLRLIMRGRYVTLREEEGVPVTIPKRNRKYYTRSGRRTGRREAPQVLARRAIPFPASGRTGDQGRQTLFHSGRAEFWVFLPGFVLQNKEGISNNHKDVERRSCLYRPRRRNPRVLTQTCGSVSAFQKFCQEG